MTAINSDLIETVAEANGFPQNKSADNLQR